MKRAVRRILQNPGTDGRRGARSGVETVEFALVVPIVFTLFFGAVELTWLNMVRNSVTNAAFLSARRAAVSGGTLKDVRKTARERLSLLRMDRGMKVSLDKTEEYAEVTVSIPLDRNSWGLSQFTNGIVIRRTVRLSIE